MKLNFPTDHASPICANGTPNIHLGDLKRLLGDLQILLGLVSVSFLLHPPPPPNIIGELSTLVYQYIELNVLQN